MKKNIKRKLKLKRQRKSGIDTKQKGKVNVNVNIDLRKPTRGRKQTGGQTKPQSISYIPWTATQYNPNILSDIREGLKSDLANIKKQNDTSQLQMLDYITKAMPIRDGKLDEKNQTKGFKLTNYADSSTQQSPEEKLDLFIEDAKSIKNNPQLLEYVSKKLNGDSKITEIIEEPKPILNQTKRTVYTKDERPISLMNASQLRSKLKDIDPNNPLLSKEQRYVNRNDLYKEVVSLLKPVKSKPIKTKKVIDASEDSPFTISRFKEVPATPSPTKTKAKPKIPNNFEFDQDNALQRSIDRTDQDLKAELEFLNEWDEKSKMWMEDNDTPLPQQFRERTLMSNEDNKRKPRYYPYRNDDQFYENRKMGIEDQNANIIRNTETLNKLIYSIINKTY